MSRKDRPLPAVQPDTLPVPVEDNIHRLREMLRLMAPERGTPALGAGIATGATMRPVEQVADPQGSRASEVAAAAA